MQNRYLRLLMYLGVWLGLNILWELRATILYSGVNFPFMFMGVMVLSFAPLIGITVLLLMTLFKRRELNLTALIWLILATVASNPPIYLLSTSVFSVIAVLICNVYLAVIICNHDRSLKHTSLITWTFAVVFVLCLMSPNLSARFAINGYSTFNSALKTHIGLTTKHKNELQQRGSTTIKPHHPNIKISGVGDIDIQITRLGPFYFSTIGNYVYEW